MGLIQDLDKIRVRGKQFTVIYTEGRVGEFPGTLNLPRYLYFYGTFCNSIFTYSYTRHRKFYRTQGCGLEREMISLVGRLHSIPFFIDPILIKDYTLKTF